MLHSTLQAVMETVREQGNCLTVHPPGDAEVLARLAVACDF
jgi:hypothetical protein